MVAEIETTRSFSRAAVEALTAAKGEPAWLRDWRLAAWATYEATPMPTRQDEDWRRTDIRALKLDEFAPPSWGEPSSPPSFTGKGVGGLGPSSPPSLIGRGAGGVGRPLPAGLRPYAARKRDLAGLLVHQDGTCVRRDVAGDLPAGVVFTDLDSAVREHGELVQRYLGTTVPATAGKFPALNAALWSGGTFVYVPRNVEVALPLASLRWQEAPGAALFPRTLIVLERGACLTFIGDSRSLDQEAAALHNGVVELQVGDNARLHYVALQRWGRHVWDFTHERARLGRDAQMKWAVGAVGGRLTKAYVQAELAQPGASARLVGVVCGDGTQHFDHHTLQDHVAPHATSDLLFKTALKDKARAVFVGLIHVHREAQQTDAYLANRNLLLSETAKADAIPRLEIEANDVRCTHGATVAPVDPEQVFYLETRGLPHDDAERMIVEGFFEPILAEIPAESIRERMREAISEKTAE
ncbi:MAG TPA: Fe-S cluster assembly protein SufD [Chloroflexota bacterium]|nr:Fe-S cluster assembly protein SufD [Chloroflexota bacterium]